MRPLLSMLAMLFVLAPTPVCACINESETKVHEEQFKSSYLDPAPETASLPARNSNLPYFVGGAGAMLLVAGLAVAFVAPSRGAAPKKSQPDSGIATGPSA
jgi:hypothetical protein